MPRPFDAFCTRASVGACARRESMTPGVTSLRASGLGTVPTHVSFLVRSSRTRFARVVTVDALPWHARAMGADSLLQFYRSLTYPVPACGAWPAVSIRIGALHPSLDARVAAHGAATWASLTAWNPDGRPRELDANLAANDALRAALGRYAVFDAPGGCDPSAPDPSTQEASFLVVGIDRETSMRLAIAFGQVAFLFGDIGGVAELVPSVTRQARFST